MREQAASSCRWGGEPGHAQPSLVASAISGMACHCGLSRRRLVLGGSAVALAGSVSVPGLAQSPVASSRRAIDVHHHLFPPFYKARAEPWLRQHATGATDILAWTPQRSLDAMDRAGVEMAILSISAPGVDFGDPSDAVQLARDCNDYAANLTRRHPGRFRFFAALPTHSADVAMAEAERALDTLGAAGVVLLTNYGGQYLGEPRFAPLFDWLNRRSAIVYVHPTSATCCAGLVPEVADPLIEFPVDTGRTITSLLWSGTLSRAPSIRFIFSHGGGILPMVASRISAMGIINPELRRRVPEGPAAALARLYVDTASVEARPALAALRAWLTERQILYGTDYPWGDPARALASLGSAGLEPDLLARIQRTNALELLA